MSRASTIARAIGNGLLATLAVGSTAQAGADTRGGLGHREFSDEFEWETKVGAAGYGLGGAFLAYGTVSADDGDAPDTISPEFFPDPETRVTVLNDQEWLVVGGQLWYQWRGLGVQVGYESVLAGRNTTQTDRLSVAIFLQR